MFQVAYANANRGQNKNFNNLGKYSYSICSSISQKKKKNIKNNNVSAQNGYFMEQPTMDDRYETRIYIGNILGNTKLSERTNYFLLI